MAQAKKETTEWVPQLTINKKNDDLNVSSSNNSSDPHYIPDLDAARFQGQLYYSGQSLPQTKRTNGFNLNSIFIKANDQIINLPLSDILWVEAYGDYVNFITEKTKYLVHSTMKAIENKLPTEQFVRVHRSFIIRAEKIDLIEESLIQIGKKLIPMGESYRQGFLTRLNIL